MSGFFTGKAASMNTLLLFLALFGALVSFGTFPSLVFARSCGGSKLCQCGDVVRTDYTMTADLGPCPKRGLTVASGVSLDCAGHAVRGSGERPEDFGIALQTATIGATVKNCDVSGFLRGIRLREANKNQILHNMLHHNGDFAAHVGYGIDVAGSQDNLFQDNHVHHNADEGIHIGTASHGNTFIGNRVEDNYRENFYFLRVERGVLRKNLVRGGGANSVFIKHSAFLRLENNEFHDKPVAFRGDAHDNVLTDNVLLNAGVRFQAYEENGSLTSPSKNLVTGGKISGAQECISFSNASGNIIKNVQLIHCTKSIVAEGDGGRAENSLIGIPVTSDAMVLNGTAVLHIGWQLNLMVKTSTGAPVTGAKVQGLDMQKQALFETVTTADGTAPSQDVIEYTLRGSTKTVSAPLSLRVSSGEKITTQELSLNKNSTITVSLP